MKIKGKVLSLLGLLSISFSPAAAITPVVCPTLDFINRNITAMQAAGELIYPPTGTLRLFTLYDDPLTQVTEWLYASNSGNGFQCIYRASPLEEPFPQLIILFTERNNGLWKIVDSSLWMNQNCKVSIPKCEVTRQ